MEITLSISDIEAIRQALGLEANDTSEDESIRAMSKSEQLNRILNWNGLLNYGKTIEGWAERVWGITL